MNRHDKYLKVSTWARLRYTNAHGSYTRCVGNGVAGQPSIDGKAFMVPSMYTVIEDLAADRYLGVARHWTGYNLANCYKGETA